MTVEFVRRLLAWCTLVDMVLLVLWWLIFMLVHDWMYRFHGRWFKLSRETFDTVHYVGMMAFKICIFLFNLVPYLVLRFIV